MRLLSFLLYIILGYLVWRMIRVVARMLQGRRDDGGGYVRTATKENPLHREQVDPRVIQDAEFEDLTPPPSPEEGNKPTSA